MRTLGAARMIASLAALGRACQIARKVVPSRHHQPPAPETEKLSKREIQILVLLVARCMFEEVADPFGIGRETAPTHGARLRRWPNI